MNTEPRAQGKLWDVPFRLGLYDMWTPINFDRSIERTFERCLGKDTQNVLDVGCGTGRALQFVKPWLIDGGRYTGVDISEGGLHAAGNRAGALRVQNHVHLQLGSMLELSSLFRTPFDAVFSHFAVYTLPTDVQRRAAVLEMLKVLKPGGKLSITVPSEQYTGKTLVTDALRMERNLMHLPATTRIARQRLWLPLLEFGTKKAVESRLDSGAFHRYTRDELVAHMHDAGLQQIEVDNVGAMGAYRAVGVRRPS